MRGKRMIGTLLAAAALMAMTACAKHESSIESTTDNTIKVTALNSEETGGSGVITVAEGEVLHLDYNLSKGTFDVTVAGEQAVPEDGQLEAEGKTTEELIESFTGEGQYKETGLTGEGSLEFAVEPGDQTLYFMLHDATGDILVTAVPAE
ncbi:MAG: hypothetical protein E7188_03550 [Erysipelotrichaceae bacterium]|nr:hypothetical protein [Erysipelotrichaceae bacterium]